MPISTCLLISSQVAIIDIASLAFAGPLVKSGSFEQKCPSASLDRNEGKSDKGTGCAEVNGQVYPVTHFARDLNRCLAEK